MTISRRTLMQMGGLTALCFAGPVPAWAKRERILGDVSEGRVPSTPGRSPEWQRAAAALRVGPAKTHGALTVFSLRGAEGQPLEITTLDEARASGVLVIAERDQAQVPELSVENRGKSHVLLLAGEILVGGKQNRVMREDILLPPLSGPRMLGVYCVEQGRWNEGRRDFDSKATFAQPGLRREVYDKAPQARVWSEVARSTRAAAAPSPTASYQQVYEQPAVRQHLDDAERALEVTLAAGTLGAAVFVGESLGGIDVFRDAGLFTREWRKLLRAYAVEAYARPPAAPVSEGKLRTELHRLIAGAAAAPGVVRGNAGVGQMFEFRLEPHRGAVLSHDGGIVHAAVL